MKVGKRVAPVVSRATRPPSWSTAETTGNGRPAAAAEACSAALAARTCPGSTTLLAKDTIPPRCSSFTRAVGGRVPV